MFIISCDEFNYGTKNWDFITCSLPVDHSVTKYSIIRMTFLLLRDYYSFLSGYHSTFQISREIVRNIKLPSKFKFASHLVAI